MRLAFSQDVEAQVCIFSKNHCRNPTTTTIPTPKHHLCPVCHSNQHQINLLRSKSHVIIVSGNVEHTDESSPDEVLSFYYGTLTNIVIFENVLIVRHAFLWSCAMCTKISNSIWWLQSTGSLLEMGCRTVS